MAYTRGRCTNVDYCSLAASRHDIEVRIGEDFVCPECARPLHAPPIKAGASGPGLLLAGVVVALVLVAGGIYAGYRLSAPHAAPTPASIATVPATPATPAAPAAPAPALARAAPPTAPAASPAFVAPPTPAPAPPPPEQTVLLRLETTPATAALAAKLAAGYLSSLGDSAIIAAPGAAAGESLVTGQRVGRPEAVALTTRDTLGGPPTQAGGGADLMLSDQRPASAAGSAEHPVARDAAAILVNPRNTLATITLAQLRGVLDGSITSWSQLGGGGGTIHLVREAGPAQAGRDALVDGAPARPGPLVADAAASVAADPDALALVALSQAARGRALPVAAVGARPASPTPAAIASGEYPLARLVYAYAPPAGGNPFAARFLAYALSGEGQDIVAKAGLVPLRVAVEAPAAPATPKDRYRALVAGATRLAADLHFEPNSNKLDLHSAREVDRVWNVMMSDHTPPDHLVLLGFADNQGTADANQALSQQRAQAVAAVFARRGLPPGQVTAFGADLPIADNATEAGREKNRRVEVYLKN
jgi:phosphate transport system substrate-binding protein